MACTSWPSCCRCSPKLHNIQVMMRVERAIWTTLSRFEVDGSEPAVFMAKRGGSASPTSPRRDAERPLSLQNLFPKFRLGATGLAFWNPS